MGKSNKNGLERYVSKINKFKSEAPNIRKTVSARVAYRGAEICTEMYALVSDIEITVKKKGKYSYRLMATDKSERPRIAYLEYGTGMEGMATYEGNLPMTNVPITNSWVYYYPSEYKVLKDDKLGWKSGKNGTIFSVGYESYGYMWKASQQLRQEMLTIAIEYINDSIKTNKGE